MEDGERSRVTPTEGVRIVRWGDAVEKRSLFIFSIERIDSSLVFL